MKTVTLTCDLCDSRIESKYNQLIYKKDCLEGTDQYNELEVVEHICKDCRSKVDEFFMNLKKNIWHIDVGNMDVDEAEEYIKKVIKKIKKDKVAITGKSSVITIKR